MSDSTLSKNGHLFWESRVYQPTYRDGRDTKTSGNYAVRIQAHGERRNVNLGETKKRAAAKAALELYRLVEAHGWDDGLAEFRSELPAHLSGITLGDWITEVMATGLISSRAINIYATKVRRIAADIANVKLPSDMNKHDHVNGGSKEWRRRVDLVPIDKLSTKAVAGWRSGRLALHRDNPAKLKSTVTTTNSDIRAGKAIFSKRIVKRLKHLTLPEPTPFSEIETTRERPTRYRCEIPNPEVLLVAGSRELDGSTWAREWETSWRELGGPDPLPEPNAQQKINAEQTAWRKREAFKILVLGLCAGLRRGEIDRLQWSQVDLVGRTINITTTDCFAPKANSEGEIPIDDEIANLLKEWKAAAADRFVVGGVEPRNDPRRYHYRCDRAQRELIRWLQAKGIQARNPLHSLRKEYGSIVCAKAGIYVASRLLRHANISMTASVYADDRGRVTPGLGAAFSGLKSSS